MGIVQGAYPIEKQGAIRVRLYHRIINCFQLLSYSHQLFYYGLVYACSSLVC